MNRLGVGLLVQSATMTGADMGGASLAGKQNLIGGLEPLNSLHPGPQREKMAASGIFDSIVIGPIKADIADQTRV